jgi:TrwC relaxase
MSIHKLSAGSGYDYLTRQVAALDATEKGHIGLASYYTERGESPGAWIGSGMAGIDGLNVGDPVTASRCGLSSAPECTPSPPSGWISLTCRLDRHKREGSNPAGRTVQGLRR